MFTNFVLSEKQPYPVYFPSTAPFYECNQQSSSQVSNISVSVFPDNSRGATFGMLVHWNNSQRDSEGNKYDLQGKEFFMCAQVK